MKRKTAFTLVEVMVAVAVLGLAAAGSLRLLALSARALEQVRSGRETLVLVRTLWIEAASGVLDEHGREKEYAWETERFDFPGQRDVPEGFFCKKVILYPGDPARSVHGQERSTFVMYVPDFKIAKGRTQ